MTEASRSRWAGRAVLGVAAAVLALNAAWVATHVDELRPIAPGDVAPAFALPEVGEEGALGAPVELRSFRGKVVLLDFWATWCAPCRESMPMIERLYRRYRDRGFEVVSINTDDAAAAHELAATLGVSFTLVADTRGVADVYKVQSIPHLVLVDRLGVVRYVHHGGASEASLAGEVEALLE